ncbi:hypothetical protein BMS3Abin08_01072 [bacterium BMS3Abin08]|nr:hypothetical protein BMS3Abin08_01072 [bacterium BMS3Abin08]
MKLSTPDVIINSRLPAGYYSVIITYGAIPNYLIRVLLIYVSYNFTGALFSFRTTSTVYFGRLRFILIITTCHFFYD